MSQEEPFIQIRTDVSREQVFVYADRAGIEALIEYLRALLEVHAKGTDDHIHLMAPEWGGTTLNTADVDPPDVAARHLKLFCLPPRPAT